MAVKFTFMETLSKDHIKSEDGGAALIVDFPMEGKENPEEGLFVRLISWSEVDGVVEHKHPEFDQLRDKKIKITLEVIE